MKYLVFIKNSLSEQTLLAEAESLESAKRELAPLIAAGFPKERTKILRASGAGCLITHSYLVFTLDTGEEMEYSLHTTDCRRDFLLAAEMICRRQLKTVTAVELQDNCHKTIYRIEMGKILLNTRAATIRPLPCELHFQPTLKTNCYEHKSRNYNG